MKIIPIPDCLPSNVLLLEQQIKEEMMKCCAVPERFLKPEKISTAREIFLTTQSSRQLNAAADRNVSR